MSTKPENLNRSGERVSDMTNQEYNDQMAAEDMRTAFLLSATVLIVIGGMLLIGWLA